MIFDGDRDKLSEYIRQMADVLGLKDWKITLDDDPCENGALASINCTYGQKYGRICMKPGWEEWEPENLREVLVHELVHAHLDPIRLPIENIRNVLGQPLYDATHNANVDAIEYATDGLAVSVARLLPLPEAAKKGKK